MQCSRGLKSVGHKRWGNQGIGVVEHCAPGRSRREASTENILGYFSAILSLNSKPAPMNCIVVSVLDLETSECAASLVLFRKSSYSRVKH